MGDEDLLRQMQEAAQRNVEQMTGGGDAVAEEAPAVEEVVEEGVADEAYEEVAADAPAAAAPPKRAAAPKQRSYTVKSGDTLSAIGERFGVSWQKIAQVNNLANPDLIHPGQTFIIPD